MKLLYETNTKYDFEEYKRFNYAIVSRINKMPAKVVAVIVLFLLLAYLYMNQSLYATSVLSMSALIFPLIIIYSINSNIKKTYDSNKSMKGLKVKFEFYDSYCLYKSEMGEEKVEYKNLYKVIETKTNFYLMVAKNQGLMLVKNNCSDKLQEFLRKLI